MNGFGLAGVMGWPIAHSRSPAIHNYWLARYGIAGAYLRLPVEPNRLADALRGLAWLGYAGVNLTVPHKEQALRFLDDIDDAARRIGSVNTVVVRPDGTLSGRSTDGFGFIENLRSSAPSWQPGAGAVVILGAGGSARAVAAALAAAGETEIRVANRTDERAQTLARDLGAPLVAWSWDKRGTALNGAHLVVNTTTQGMVGQAPLQLDLAALPANAIVADLVYVPLETPLLAAARLRCNPTVDGLGMLLHQARAGFAAWFGVDPVVDDALRRHVLETFAA